MDSAQKLAVLKRWQEAIQAADEHFDAMCSLMGLQPEGPTFSAIWGLQGALTSATADLLDDGVWLEWYWLENDMGLGEKKASPAKGVDLRPIKTLQDLLWLLEYDKT